MVEGTADSALVLMYHSIDRSGSVVSIAPERLAEHAGAIAAAGLRGVTLAELVEARSSDGRWPAGHVAITFDDGFANLRQHALPTLAEHGFSATVFVVSDHVGGKNDWADPPAGLGSRALMNWEEIEEMKAAGWEIGAHTRTHPDVRGLDGRQLEKQIIGCRDDIEARSGIRAECFAYPYGYTSAAAVDLVAASFTAACTTELRRATDEQAALLPRIDAYYLREAGRMRSLLEGRLDGYLRVRRWGRAVRGALAKRAIGY